MFKKKYKSLKIKTKNLKRVRRGRIISTVRPRIVIFDKNDKYVFKRGYPIFRYKKAYRIIFNDYNILNVNI